MYTDYEIKVAKAMKDQGGTEADFQEWKSQNTPKPTSTMNEIGTSLKNVAGGVVSSVPDTLAGASNLGSYIEEYNPISAGAGYIVDAVKAPFSDKTFSEIRDERSQRYEDQRKNIADIAQQAKADIQKTYGTDPNAISTKIGEGLGALALPVPGLGKMKGVSTLGKIGLNALEGAGQNLAYGNLQSLGETGNFSSLGENAMNAGIGAVVNPALKNAIVPLVKGGAGAISKVPDSLGKRIDIGKSTLTRTLPEKTIANDLGFTPTTRESVERITGITPEQYILQKGLGGKGKGELAEVFMKQADDNYQAVTTELGKIPQRVESKSAKVALDDMLEDFSSLSKLEQTHYVDDIALLNKLASQSDYSLSELNGIRRAFDKVNTGMYTAKGAVRAGTRKEAEVGVRNGLSSDIQDNALLHGVDVKGMNQELRVALEMKDALLARLSQENKNNLVGLQDIGIAGIFSGGDPATALALGISKKFFEAKAPGIAQKLFNLSDKAYEKSSVRRGNTISRDLSTSKLGLPNNLANSDAISGKGLTAPSITSQSQPTIKASGERNITSIAPYQLESKLKGPTLTSIDKNKPITSISDRPITSQARRDEVINMADGWGDMKQIPKELLSKLLKSAGTSKIERVDIAKPSPTVISLLQKEGIDNVVGHRVTSNGIQHALKEHGEGALLRRNEIPVTEKDIAIIPEIQSNPDKIYVSPYKSKSGEIVLVYEKRIGNKYYYLEHYEENGGYLDTKTMYINK